MPQAPSTNMLIVWPTDKNDNDAWDVIQDTAIRVTIDSHDHSAGKGVLVPTGALKIDADISWSFGGTSRAILDLRAVDFSPQPASGMTALAGAFFLNSADNELYFRNFTGTNIKVTAGAALNVAAFTGGIGGDYASVNALVVFDDATDSYWFQQQVGAAVRQYARMRSADVDLYEFKANPAAGVPVQRVRLASPAALAASYALTFPGALPTSKGLVQIDSTGLISISGAVWPIPPTSGQVANGSATTFSQATNALPGVWIFSTTSWVDFPLYPPVGSVITAWTIDGNKNSASGTISAVLWDASVGGQAQIGATQSNSAVSPGAFTVGQSGLTTTVQAGHDYHIVVTGGAASTTDSIRRGTFTT